MCSHGTNEECYVAQNEGEAGFGEKNAVYLYKPSKVFCALKNYPNQQKLS